MKAEITVADDGTVTLGRTSGPEALVDCVEQAAKSWRAPAGTKAHALARVSFRARERRPIASLGRKAEIDRLTEEDPKRAATVATEWAEDWPADVAAHLAQGRTLHALGHVEDAEQAWGSIADWHPLTYAARRDALAWLRSGGDAPLSRRTFPRASEPRAAPGQHRPLRIPARLDGDAVAAFALLEGALADARLLADFGAIDTLEEDAARLASVLVTPT